MKVGVLGGTFDPVHLGHIQIAEEARKSLDLSEIIFVPAGQPPFKSDYPITPAEQRLQMLHLAVARKPYLKISTVEIERPGPSYTVDTIAELKHRYSGDDEIYFILGWDSLEQLAGWREPSRLIRMCYLVVVPRPGSPPPNMESLEASIPGISQRLVFLERPNVDISSSAIRELAVRSAPINNLVPGSVAGYIREHNLYLTQ